MEIRKITTNDIPELIRFGLKMFPESSGFYSDLIHFVFDGRINGNTGGIVLCEENGKIVGQNLTTEMTLDFRGQNINAVWGFGLIVEERLRQDAWGIELILGTKKLFPYSCATGSGPDALKMNLKLGYRLIGEIRKYIAPSSLLKLPVNLIFPAKKIFPNSVDSFNIVHNIDNVCFIDKVNDDLVKANRNPDWLKWRFFTPGFRQYKFYQNKSGDWFVVRKIKYKGLRMLIIVDFRCSLQSTESFNNIWKAVKKIANSMRIPFIFCGSSNKFVDEVMEKNHAKSIGRPRPVIVSKLYKNLIDKERVDNRDFCLITLADSDGEWHYEDK